jgi:translation elongation factor IF5A
MVLRHIQATHAKPGTTILIDGEAYTVKSMGISKAGKHGPSKCRIEAIAIFSDKKKIIAVPGDTRFEVPNVDKHKAQVLSTADNLASVMDLESYETLELPFLPELKDKLEPETKVEYWDVEGKKMIMRVQ